MKSFHSPTPDAFLAIKSMLNALFSVIHSISHSCKTFVAIYSLLFFLGKNRLHLQQYLPSTRNVYLSTTFLPFVSPTYSLILVSNSFLNQTLSGRLLGSLKSILGVPKLKDNTFFPKTENTVRSHQQTDFMSGLRTSHLHLVSWRCGICLYLTSAKLLQKALHL